MGRHFGGHKERESERARHWYFRLKRQRFECSWGPFAVSTCTLACSLRPCVLPIQPFNSIGRFFMRAICSLSHSLVDCVNDDVSYKNTNRPIDSYRTATRWKTMRTWSDRHKCAAHSASCHRSIQLFSGIRTTRKRGGSS